MLRPTLLFAPGVWPFGKNGTDVELGVMSNKELFGKRLVERDLCRVEPVEVTLEELLAERLNRDNSIEFPIFEEVDMFADESLIESRVPFDEAAKLLVVVFGAPHGAEVPFDLLGRTFLWKRLVKRGQLPVCYGRLPRG